MKNLLKIHFWRIICRTSILKDCTLKAVVVFYCIHVILAQFFFQLSQETLCRPHAKLAPCSLNRKCPIMFWLWNIHSRQNLRINKPIKYTSSNNILPTRRARNWLFGPGINIGTAGCVYKRRLEYFSPSLPPPCVGRNCTLRQNSLNVIQIEHH